MSPERRKWLPAEAYRFLVLLALLAREGQPATKRELAWETRANHYMITRVLGDLQREGLVRLSQEATSWEIRATPEGGAFAARHEEYILRTFGAVLGEHFRYGRSPAWARRLTTESPIGRGRTATF